MVLPFVLRTSPGRPMTRFTRSVTGSLQIWATSGGALKTTMSPTLMVPKSTLSLSTRMRLPEYRVGSIEGEGMRNVCMTYVRIVKETRTAAMSTRTHSITLLRRDLTFLTAATSGVGSLRSCDIEQQYWLSRTRRVDAHGAP